MESSLRGHAARQQQLHQQQQQQSQSFYRGGGGSVTGGMGRSHHGSSHPADMSLGSHYSRGSHGSSNNSSSVVDEAYRRLGRRLSIRAHGDGPLRRPQQLSRIGLTEGSSFVPFNLDLVSPPSPQQQGAVKVDNPVSPSGVSLNNRTKKVAKTRYNDHGDHNHHKAPSQYGNVVRKMTINAADLFKLWHADAAAASKGRKKRSPKLQTSSQYDESGSTDLSPQRFAFSQLALDSNQQTTQQLSHHSSKLSEHFMNTPDNKMISQKHGLLSAVIENASVTSSHTYKYDNETRSVNSPGSSIATKSSVASSFRALPQGKCLTQPAEPVANDGLDNTEGNLIVHENDAISISRRQIHVLTKDNLRNATHADFRIQGLLGQGTFAQVFQCLHLQTGNQVAVKIVKNKPAYTRQAAVEIDVFRALTKKQEKVASSSQSQSKLSVSPSNSIADNSVVSQQGGGTKGNYMVDLVCYFMYKNHLCLVFELLGLNLYDVLKKRQFRGLPLSIVRTLVKQAVGGVKELAKKSIVHCDLKPENILLVTEDDVDSVVSAGESKRLARSADKGSSLASELKPGESSVKSKNKIYPGQPPMAPSGGLNRIIDKTPASASVDLMSQSPSNHSVGTTGTAGASLLGQKIKLIDFGSACFEGQTSHTYIQSRFYRSPEVLVGLPYDSAIDMWSLGCVAAELFLGLPILPGVHEHDQLGRICEMISKPPDWMLDQGSKASKYFVKYVPRDGPHVPTPTPPPPTPPPGTAGGAGTVIPVARPLPQWRIRTQQEYIASLSQSEIRKKGGLSKLEKQPGNRYFKRKMLKDIVTHKGLSGTPEDKNALELFIHFLYGILDPDPWKRWTAHQAAHHPFLIGGPVQRTKGSRATNPEAMKEENQANLICEIHWEPPWDPNICRRKLLNVQKMREKQQVARRSYGNRQPNIPARPSSTGALESVERVGSSGMHESPMRGMHSDGSGSSPSQPPVNQGQYNGQNQTRQGLGALMASQGPGAQMHQVPYQLSSSLTEYANGQGPGGRLMGDSASVMSTNSRQFMAGGQSYAENGYIDPMTGSYDVDFAYALQRPGVVPMGDSVASSIDMGVVPNNMMHQTMMGSYGSNRNQMRTNQRRGSSSSRSVGEMDTGDSRRHSLGPAGGSIPNMPYGSSQGSLGGQMDMYSQSAQQQMHQMQQMNMMKSIDEQILPMGSSAPTMPQDGSVSQNLQQQIAYGNAEAYLRQQHAALQQQQALLQQQQAALALQQQQLQAYQLNPALFNAGGAAGHDMNNFGGMNQLGQTGGGYYYVSSADGTPMMVSNQGLSQQQSFMNQGFPYPGMSYGMPPQQHQQMYGYQVNNGDPNYAANQGFNPPNPNNFPSGGMSM